MVTINENLKEKCYCDNVMMNTADDLYDNGKYGYDKVHGDGILILDNWYEDENGSQKGTWLSTCGKVYEQFSTSDIDSVIDQIYWLADSDPYSAYRAGIRQACELYDICVNGNLSMPIWLIVLVPVGVALIFAAVKLKQSPARDTTTPESYVAEGSRRMNVQTDDYIRKSVVSTSIMTGSSGSSGGHYGGRGGSHVSHSGVSHGGGGRRR